LTKEKRKQRIKRGLVIINTGDGKGKTTAALGAMLRAWGRGLRVCMIQFLKHERGKWGEVRAADNLEGFDLILTGDGFSWRSKDEEASKAKARQAWQHAQEMILSGEYDLVVLYEFTYPLDLGWIETEAVLGWLEHNKPKDQHIIITGRRAPASLVKFADLVTEMVKIKHPHDEGLSAQAGIEF
jgi:cob(I)alamin adenosyltransferase